MTQIIPNLNVIPHFFHNILFSKSEQRRKKNDLSFQILLMFATVVTFGAIASLRNSTQFWSMYSIAQGVQVICIPFSECIQLEAI